MPRSQLFWHIIANHYSRQKIADEAAYEFKLEKTREYLNAESRVFEFGCGTGSTALLHAPRVKEVLATDYSGRMIRIANQKKEAAGISNVQFEQATIFSSSAEAGSFDVVLGLNVLHLMKDYREGIRRAFELLKPGGHFFSSTACILETTPHLKYVLAPFSALRLIPYVAMFDIATFKQAIEEAGFSDVEVAVPGKDKNVVFTVARKT